MGNNEREIIKQICDEENFEELLLEIRARGKSNKLKFRLKFELGEYNYFNIWIY